LGLDNIKQKHSVRNYILILIKHYAYQTKCLNKILSLQSFLSLFKESYAIEKKYVAFSKGFLEEFNRMWNKYKISKNNVFINS